jgi:hypothetical protein
MTDLYKGFDIGRLALGPYPPSSRALYQTESTLDSFLLLKPDFIFGASAL